MRYTVYSAAKRSGDLVTIYCDTIPESSAWVLPIGVCAVSTLEQELNDANRITTYGHITRAVKLSQFLRSKDDLLKDLPYTTLSYKHGSAGQA